MKVKNQNSDQWDNNVSSILNTEVSFHDNWASSINVRDIPVDQFFTSPSAPENRIIIEALGDIKGKNILDLGCGAGEAAVYFAKKGAVVTACDISSNMLKTAEKLADYHSVSIFTSRSASDRIDCYDNFYDIVYAGNLFHHVNIDSTLKEIKRVLKPQGLVVSWDPLDHNPLIKIYRRIATEVRTMDEHPLKMRDINLFKRYFNIVTIKGTWFFTLWIFIKFYFFDRIDPNKERYWKKIIFNFRDIEKIYMPLKKIDDFILSIFPFLKRYCWNITIIARLKEGNDQ